MITARNRIIIILAAVLLAVAVSSVVLLWLVPNSQEEPRATPSPSPTAIASPDVGFDVSVFQTQAYKLLNQQLVQEGALPVTPPTATGKTNPFR